MSKIHFKVSARTARLIGMQNFTNAESAIIELVKNSYDADASKCIIIFDNKYNSIPYELNGQEFEEFKNNYIIKKLYKPMNGKKNIYALQDLDASNKAELKSFFLSQCRVFLFDDGEGMTDKIIEDYWMVIGTNHKQNEIYTKNNRVKTGEKGIGRFALDRIGNKAEMLTKPDILKHGLKYKDAGFLWQIDWSVFDKDSTTLDKIEVDVIQEAIPDFPMLLKDILPISERIKDSIELEKIQQGTYFEIKNLRDNWDGFTIENLFKNLELLVPPREVKDFKLFVYSTKDLSQYGEVLPVHYADYDYRLLANVSSAGKVDIKIYRNEYDLERFDSKLYKQIEFQQKKYRKEDFQRGYIKYSKNITELIPGFKSIDEEDSLSKLGAFSLNLYFLKTSLNKESKAKFLYKDINSSLRKKWLRSFAGIKLFRDHFRVKPYGEAGGQAFDWLGIGERAARSPAGIGKKEGGWRVRPNSVAGIINISRLNNLNFDDVSGRHGIQENDAFRLFKTVILRIINEFENDRSYIARALRKYYEGQEQNINPNKVKQVVNKYTDKNQTGTQTSQETKEDAKFLSSVVIKQEEIIEEMKNEQQMLRILASNALITASFSHQLEGIKNNLITRIDDAKEYFELVTDQKILSNLEEYENPFIMLEDIKNDDIKLKEWLNYSILFLGRDKRRRRLIEFNTYFENYKKNWDITTKSRGIKLNILPLEEELKMRVFEIDLDCIFNNLLINSIYAFNLPNASANRQIEINVTRYKKNIDIIYRDSGPGLDKDIKEPEKIFEPYFTTKRNYHTGEETGTGLGMWLVKTFVIENNGKVRLLFDKPGFGLHITFANKISEKDV